MSKNTLIITGGVLSLAAFYEAEHTAICNAIALDKVGYCPLSGTHSTK